KPAPKPVHVSHPATPSSRPTPVTPTPAATPVRPVTKRPTVKAKPHKVRAKKKKKKAVKVVQPKPKKAPTVTTVKEFKPAGFVPTKAATDSTSIATLLIVLSLGFAIACFGVASLPPALLPRRAAYYVLPRQTGLVVLGVGLFGVVVLTFFW